MDKQYIIDRVRSDLRNEIYELMTHVGYHELEKELTEMVLKNTPVYVAIRAYSLNQSVPLQEKNERKELFAYIVYRAMNEALGGFHFDRYKSLCTGSLETMRMSQILQNFSFEEFINNYDRYQYLKQEPEWEPFVHSRQFRHLEDAITSSVKKNRVIPGVSKAIGKDIVDALSLTEDYGYVRVSDELKDKLFEPPDGGISPYVSLHPIPITVKGQRCRVLLRRASRTDNRFRLLLTNFGALIKGAVD